MRLRDKLIELLGGYTPEDWARRCVKEDRRFDEAMEEKDEVLAKLISLSSKTPDDCKRGAWCELCAFASRTTVRTGQFPYHKNHTVFYCGKDGICKHLLRTGDTDA
jgi:hypothetical protein